MSRPLVDGDFATEHAGTRRRVVTLERKPNDIYASYEIKIFSDTQTVTAGDGKFIFAIPTGVGVSGVPDGDGLLTARTRELLDVSTFITTVSSSGAVTVMIRNQTQTADMLSTACSITAGDFISSSGAVDALNSAVLIGDLIAIDVDAAGTGAMGLGVILRFGDGGGLGFTGGGS